MAFDPNAFFASLMPAALKASQATGVDPRIILGQAALESDYGRHAPNNNYFGIKGPGQSLATTEVINGQPVRTTASFRGYASPDASVAGYANFINSNPRYRPLRSAQGLDAQLRALGASGYATDPNYAAKVGSIARKIDIPGAPVMGSPMVADTAPQAASQSVASPLAAMSAKNVPGAVLAAASPNSGQSQTNPYASLLGSMAPQQQVIQPPRVPQQSPNSGNALLAFLAALKGQAA